MRRGRSTARTLAAGASLVVVILLIVELWLRLVAFGWSTAALGPWQRRIPWEAIRTVDGDGISWPRPGSAARWGLHPGEPPVEYRFDAHGFRTLGPLAQSPPATCRVLVAGESNAFGYGVPAADAFPSQLAERSSSNGLALQVTNAATWGSNVAEQGRQLERALDLVRPHVVVLTISPWSLRLDPYPGGPEGVTILEKVWNVLDRWARRLAGRSAVADRLRRRVLHVTADLLDWPPPSMVAWELAPLIEAPARFEERWEGVAPVLERMVDRIRRRDVAPLLLYVPLDVQVNRDRNRLYREEKLPYTSHGFREHDYTRDERYRRALGLLAEKLAIDLIDMTDALRAAPTDPFLARDYHMGAAGYRMIARALEPAIQAACPRRARS